MKEGISPENIAQSEGVNSERTRPRKSLRELLRIKPYQTREVYYKEIPEKITYRVQGELERDNPEIDPLEPTPITPMAEERLLSWGVDSDDIKHLRELTSSMRYDLVVERAQRIAENGAYIHENFTGTYVIVPDVFDINGKLDGQCSEIALDLLRLLNTSGLLDDINAKLTQQKRAPLAAFRVEGKSRTHFNTQKSRHLWVGLAPEDKAKTEMVTVDGSFQEISTNESNGYQVTDEDSPIEYSHPTALIVPTDSYDGVFFSGSGRNAVILGLSVDKNFIYRMGFVENVQTGAIDPHINCLNKSGEIQAVCMPDINGTNKWLDGLPDNPEVREEVNAIIDILKAMPLTRDPEKERAALDKRVTIAIN